jgi:hypothetical protein
VSSYLLLQMIRAPRLSMFGICADVLLIAKMKPEPVQCSGGGSHLRGAEERCICVSFTNLQSTRAGHGADAMGRRLSVQESVDEGNAATERARARPLRLCPRVRAGVGPGNARRGRR